MDAVFDTRASATYSEYNLVTVDLPAEALGAVEVPPPPTIPASPSQSLLPEIIAGVSKATAALKSYEFFSSDAGGINLGRVDFEHWAFYLDQSLPTHRMEYYYTNDATYERRNNSSVWSKGPGIGGIQPLFTIALQRIIEMLETAEITLDSGGSGDIECYVLHVKDGFAEYLKVDPSKITGLDFMVYVAKEGYQIISVYWVYTITENGVASERMGHINFSKFNQVIVTVPPDVLNAVAPPAPLPPTTAPQP